MRLEQRPGPGDSELRADTAAGADTEHSEAEDWDHHEHLYSDHYSQEQPEKVS